MLGFIIRRILWAIPVIIVISLISFTLMHSVPGNPFDQNPDKPLPPAIVERLREYYQLDDPLPKQYVDYVINALKGDLGPSYQYRDRTVNMIIARNFPVSLKLGLLGLSVALVIGVPLGIVSALKQNTAVDYFAMFFAISGVSVPAMTLGPLLIWIFALQLGILPVARWGSWEQAILPAITLGIGGAAILARLTRASMLQVIREDYIRTARAKGVSERMVTIKHALRNALIPVVTVLGPMLAGIVTGSMIVERIFAIPGMGRFYVDAVSARDYPVIMGMTLVYAVLLVTANLIVDITYSWIDPRITNRRTVIGIYMNTKKNRDSLWRDAFRRLLKNKIAVVGGVFLIFLAIIAIFAPIIAPYHFADGDFDRTYAPPGGQFVLGADFLGRDMLSRLIYGTRISLLVGLLGALFAFTIGTLYGTISGYAGGRTDNVMMRIVDILYAFPSLLFIILLMVTFKSGFTGEALQNPFVRFVAAIDKRLGGMLFIMIGISLTSWVGMARLSRGMALSLRETEFVQAAHALGAGNLRIVVKHLVPNLVGPMLVRVTLAIPGYIGTEAFLSFIGLGADPPTPSWGMMIQEGFKAMRSHPHLALFPGIALALVMLSFNFLGDGLRDALDPRMKQ